MITVIVSAQTLAGKIGEAIGFAKQVAEMSARIAPAFPRWKVGTSFAGAFGKIFWQMELESVAQYEQMIAAVSANPEY